MLQDRNTNVKVDAWIKQFNEEQKVQDQRIANLEETEKTVQNATCFDGCTSAQWKDYIANNPATDIETDNFRVHNNTSEIKLCDNVELKSGSSKVEVDGSSVTNETQFTNQFSEVSKAKTEIYSGDDSTHFEAKAECGPEGKSSCIRVSADYSLLHTSTSNTDYGNYYFSNNKAEFTFPNHCFEFCCDGLFFIDGQPSSANNAICFDGCDSDCWRDYIAAQIPAKAQDSFCFDGCDSDCWRDYISAQIPSKAQDTYCFDGCDATCWKDYIDSKAGSPSSITSPDGCALVTTTCNGNQIYMCEPTFTLGHCYNSICFCTCVGLHTHSSENCFCSTSRNSFCVQSTGVAMNRFEAFSYYNCLASNIFIATGTYGINCFEADRCNYFYSHINHLRGTGDNIIQSDNHCWVFCCDGNLYKDGSEFSVSNAACLDGCDAACWRAYINNNIKSCICLGTRKVALTTDGLCVNDGRLCFEYKCCSQGGSYYDCYATLSLYDDPPSDGASFLRIQNTNGLSRNFIELVASNAIYLCGDVRICCGNHCWEFCRDGNLYKDGVCVL